MRFSSRCCLSTGLSSLILRICLARMSCSLAALEPSGATRWNRLCAVWRVVSIIKISLNMDARGSSVQRSHLRQVEFATSQFLDSQALARTGEIRKPKG
ncbi:hypothetical protein AM571_PC01332 (plasmid) [Rhizobium etli 8C-3]|uniref:Secreted protein n=1 Tax=Rhizobium etli 8C-3 TaxID=538025 RepID=A0A1L5PFV5_RHIET|nr:hypothetical protein AM571_PC01332 [Rhizobium etli 8C-3]